MRYNKHLPISYYIYGNIDERDKETLLSLMKANVINFDCTLKKSVFFDALEEVAE